MTTTIIAPAPTTVAYGCHADCAPGESVYPDCVLDYGRPHDCIHASVVARREDCHEWRPVTMITPAIAKQGGAGH